MYAATQEAAGPFLPWCAQVQTDIAQLGAQLQEVWRNHSLLTAMMAWDCIDGG